tara:strand:+ start:1111 stop:1248 length:138 start_codon:yes stop_codon:yes gene_type:complete
MRYLEGQLRKMQNNMDPPSLKRAEKIQKLKTIKEAATMIGPAGPN